MASDVAVSALQPQLLLTQLCVEARAELGGAQVDCVALLLRSQRLGRRLQEEGGKGGADQAMGFCILL